MIHLICGSTGAGKTTYAMALAERIGGVRFSIDEWMTTLFWMDTPQPMRFDWSIERVRRCNAQIWATASQVALRGVPAVLDLGFSTAAGRREFYDLGEAAGLTAQLHFVDVPADVRWRRVEQRNIEQGATFRMQVTREMFDLVEGMWEAPDAAEMATHG